MSATPLETHERNKQVQKPVLQSYGVLLVVAAGCLWGTSGTLQAYAPAGATSTTVGAVRVFGTGAILLAITLATGARRFFSGPWPLFPVLLGGFSTIAYQLSFFAAARMTGAGIAAIITIGSAPTIAGAMGKALFGERLSLKWCVATALAVLGGALLVSGGTAAAGCVDPLGASLALLAGCFYSLQGVGMKMIGQTRTSFETTTAIFAAAGAMAVPFLLTPDSAWIFSWHGLLIAVLLATVSSALAFSLFTKGLLIVGVAKSYTLSLSEPLTAWLLSTVLLGQKLAPTALVGVAVICGALALLATDMRKNVEAGALSPGE